MTFTLTGTTLVALAEEKLIFALSTMNQSKLCKENTNSPCVVLFLPYFFATKIDFAASKMQCSAKHTSNQDDVNTWRKKVPQGKQSAKSWHYSFRFKFMHV